MPPGLAAHATGMHLKGTFYLLPDTQLWLPLCCPKLLTFPPPLSLSLIPAFLFLSSPSDPFPPSFAGFCSLSFHEQRVSSLAPGQHIWTKGSNLRGRRHLASPFPGPAPWLPGPEREKGARASLPRLPVLGKALRDGVKSKVCKQTQVQIPNLPLEAVDLGQVTFQRLSPPLCTTAVTVTPILKGGSKDGMTCVHL